MKKLLNIIMLLGLSSCVFTYDPPPDSGKIILFNHTDSAIYIYSSCVDTLLNSKKLTLFKTNKANQFDQFGEKLDSIYSPDYRINAHSHSFLQIGGTTQRPVLPCQHDTIFLFFITEYNLGSKNWAEICSNVNLSKKVVLTKEQLVKNDWKYHFR
ncbi:MAG: hypothetical protein FD155_3163 [Bacteroidetes bacterium]|nr:MAG: hypothetical protein FD155_3163 [Bacteroidota bacterium]